MSETVMSETVNHPDHYKHPSGVECWQISCRMPHSLASAFEYIWRHDSKNGLEDLAKARWWLKNALNHLQHGVIDSNIFMMILLARVCKHEAYSDCDKSQVFMSLALAAVSLPNNEIADFYINEAKLHVEKLMGAHSHRNSEASKP